MKQYLASTLKEVNPIDVRVVLDSLNWESPEQQQVANRHNFAKRGMPSQIQWFRARDRLPDDEHVHHAVLAYHSDWSLLSTARVATPAKLFWQSQPMISSVDHSMWFHEPFPSWRADEWLCYVTYSPRMTGARALAHGHVYTRDGRLVVSCSQEGLIRLGQDRKLQPKIANSSKL